MRQFYRGNRAATGVNPYMYVDPANPTFSTRWGGGNNATTFRTILAPQHKRVIIDGTTSINGNYYHVASFTAAQSLTFTAGDWWLLPGGGTHSGQLGELIDASHTGFRGNSLSDMAVLGTFDPADKENDSKYNTLTYTVDMTGVGVDGNALFCIRAVPMAFVSVQNFIFKASDGDPGTSVYFGQKSGFHDFLFENCKFDHVYVQIQGNPWSSGSMTSQLTTDTFNDFTYKLCTFSYANGNQNERTGNLYATMARRVRLERCMAYHNGWGDTMTRATIPIGETGHPTTLGCGPDLFKHNIYFSDMIDTVNIMDCVFGWDAANMKLTGGNYFIQNLVNVHDPIPIIFDAYGNNSAAWPSGAIFQCVNQLQVGTADINTFSTTYNRGWGAQIYSAITGSYFSSALIFNQDNPQPANRTGVETNANGQGIATNCPLINNVFASWTPNNQTTETNTTKTFTGNIWDEASIGSNTSWTDLPAPTQAKRTALLALNVYSTFATAQGISVSQIGTNLDIELRVLDYIRDNWTSQDWCAALQTHFRSALA